MTIENIEKVILGDLKLQTGSFLMTQEDIISEQKTWDDGDLSKSTDFTTSPFWIVTDDGESPVGIDDDSDIAEWM